MKRIFLMFICLMLLLTVGCGKVEEEGILYTENEIFIDCIKIQYPEAFTSKMMIIENENQLNFALNRYVKLGKMPRFDEIMESYPVGDYVYIVQFFETSYESETITCQGILVDKEKETIRFKTERDKKKSDTFGSVAGYITYAVFPKAELEGLHFVNQVGVMYPGEE